MKKELPGIFKNNIKNKYSNNKKVCYLKEDDQNTTNNTRYKEESLLTVEEKIKKLFKSSRYIFNINVIIKTKNKDYDTKIAGKVKNSLVTVENEIIPIIEIEDIIIKDRI